MKHTLPELPYSYNSLEPYIDEKTMQIHHDKHHATYVNNLNDALKDNTKLLSYEVTELIRNLDKVPDDIRTKVRNNGGGHANHSFFWTIMAPSGKGGGGEALGKLSEAIRNSFTNIESFKEKFTAAGMGRFGSGWAWLVVNKERLEIMDTPNQDSPLMDGKVPILGLDVWEHAYYLKYQNRRVDYINAWWNVINWRQVEKEFIGAFK